MLGACTTAPCAGAYTPLIFSSGWPCSPLSTLRRRGCGVGKGCQQLGACVRGVAADGGRQAQRRVPRQMRVAPQRCLRPGLPAQAAPPMLCTLPGPVLSTSDQQGRCTHKSPVACMCALRRAASASAPPAGDRPRTRQAMRASRRGSCFMTQSSSSMASDAAWGCGAADGLSGVFRAAYRREAVGVGSGWVSDACIR